MCCVVAALFTLGPRAAILLWWLVQPIRWSETFDTFLWPLVGFLILPWTTLMYVLVYPGGMEGFDYIGLGMGGARDVFGGAGGGYPTRGGMPPPAPCPWATARTATSSPRWARA